MACKNCRKQNVMGVPYKMKNENGGKLARPMSQAQVRAAGINPWLPKDVRTPPNMGMGEVVRAQPLTQGQQFLTVDNKIATFLYKIHGNSQVLIVCTIANDRSGTAIERRTIKQAEWNTLIGDSRPL